jgi:hypothetical protein
LHAQYRMTLGAVYLLLFETLDGHHGCAPLANILLMIQWSEGHADLRVQFSLAQVR